MLDRLRGLSRPVHRRPRNRRDGERGQILVLFTLVIVVLMALASVVIDVGLLRTDTARLQNALDSAALAAGQSLPASAANVAAVQATAVNRTTSNYPGVNPPTTTFQCLVGIDANGLPRVGDMPLVCNVSFPANSSAWRCTGVVCWAPCDPVANPTDICNTIQLADSAVRQFSFGAAVGVDSGNTGTLTAAVCTGVCGDLPTGPVDAVAILDRTSSMDQSGSVANLRSGALSVLQAFDPAMQRVALGFTGPTSLYRTSGGNFGSKTSSQPTTTCTAPNTVHALALSPGAVVPGAIPGYSSASQVSNDTAGASTLVLNRPTGTVNGSFLLAAITVDGGNNTTITPPAGWTLVQRTDSGNFLNLATYRRFAGGSEPTSYSWSISPTARASGGIARFSGVDSSNPIADANDSNASNSSASLAVGSVTPSSGNTMLVGVFASDSNATFLAPGGMTERFDLSNVNAGGPATMVATQGQASSGSSGSRTATASLSARWAAQLIALRPAAGGTDIYGTDPASDLGLWIPLGFTGLDADSPAVTFPEPYIDASGNPNSNSNIVQAIGCFDVSSVGTNIARPMYMATEYLNTHGRPGVKRGIIIETDGDPQNSGHGPASDYTTSGVLAAAQAAKDAGIEVFTIGYGVSGSTVTLLASMASDKKGGDTCTAAENTDGDHFFCQPVGSDLSGVLHAAAVQLSGGSRLIQLYAQPIVTAIAPSAGAKAGGTTVTITGRNFSDAYSVTFGGVKADSFTVLSDTSIRAVSPAGSAGSAVDIQVSSPGGSSKVVAGGRFTYGP